MADESPTSAAPAAKPILWKHIGLHGHSVGTFTASPKGIQWKSGFGDDVGVENTERSVSKKHIAGAQWTVFGRNGHLRIQLSQHKSLRELRLDGFPPQEFDNIKKIMYDYYGVDLVKHSMSTSGTSFGNSHVKGHQLVFSQCILEDAEEEGQEFETRNGAELFSFDLQQVSQCVLPGNNRNEIELQFPESDTLEAGTDQLVAIRFYVPPAPDADPQDKTTPSEAEVFQEQITKLANIKKTTGDVLVEFEESQGTFLTPRGRYAIELYEDFLRMRGNKYDYKIKYDDISRLFLLPKPDDVHVAFVIALDKPIRQGQQRYQNLVLQTTKEQSSVTVNLTDEQLKQDYNGDLQQTMVGSLSNLIAKTFKVICRKKVFIPGKFANAHQQQCVKCALRANEGHLYPLEKQFIFIHKPPVLIRFEHVESVEFQRYAGGQGSTRNFDLCVTLNSSSTASGAQKEYIFSGIDRSDYAGLYNFLSGKKIRIKNLQQDMVDAAAASAGSPANQPMYLDEGGESGESSEDEDYNEAAAKADESSSEDDSDMDDDDLADVDDDDDSVMEDARKAAGKKKRPASDEPPKKKKSKKPKPAAVASPKKKKTKKKKKDPNAPKRAMSSYMLFSNAKRSQIKEANPDASFGDVARLVAAAFKELSDEDRKEWDEKAEADKKRYKEEMANYSAPESSSSDSDSDDSSDSDDDDNKKKKQTKKKDPNAPKKARSAYTFFMAQERERIKKENPEATFGELAKLVGAEFKKLSADDKTKWDDMATKDKSRYQREMAGYAPPASSAASAKQTSGTKKKAKKDPNAPKRALTAFMYFSSAMRPKLKEDNPDMKFGEMGKRIGEMYKNLTPEEMEKYEKKAEADKVRYKEEMEAYNKKQAKEAAAAAASDSDDSSDDDDSDDGSGDKMPSDDSDSDHSDDSD